MASNQGVDLQEASHHNALGGHPMGTADPALPGQTSKPFAYVKPLSCQTPTFVQSALLAQRGRSRRRESSQRSERGWSRGAGLHRNPGVRRNSGLHRNPGLHGDSSLHRNPSLHERHLLGLDMHVELDNREDSSHSEESETRQMLTLPFTREAAAAATAAAAVAAAVPAPGPHRDSLPMRYQRQTSTYGYWDFRGSQPSAICPYIGFIPTGSALIAMHMSQGTYLFVFPGPSAPRQPPSL